MAHRNRTTIRLYAFSLTLAAAVSVAAGVEVSDLRRRPVVALLAAVACASERRSLRIGHNVELTVTFLPLMLAGVLFGPVAGGIVGAAALLGDPRGPAERFLILLSTRVLVGVAGGFVAVGVGGLLAHTTLLDFLAASLAAVAIGEGADFALASATGLLRRGQSPTELFRLVRGALGASLGLFTPLTALFAYAFAHAGYLVLVFFLIPILAAHLTHAMFSRQSDLIGKLRDANDDLAEANARLRKINLSFAAAMVRALDARDAYTAGHSAAVAVYSRDIAKEIGLDEASVELIHLTGLVHDIGKIGLRAEVLQKTSSLTDEEWQEMRRHAEIGAHILSEVDDYAEVARIVRSHHERWDGAGYPDGLAGETIPLLARVIAVADAYNAMTSSRPYRKAMSPETGIGQLLLGRGSQFEGRLVDAFVAVLERESEQYRLGLLTDFSLEAMKHPGITAPPEEELGLGREAA